MEPTQINLRDIGYGLYALYAVSSLGATIAIGVLARRINKSLDKRLSEKDFIPTVEIPTKRKNKSSVLVYDNKRYETIRGR